MTSLKAFWARLAGWRVYLLAALLAVPEVLEGLAGFDWGTVLPDALQIYAAKIGGGLAIVRLALVPPLRRARRQARRAARVQRLRERGLEIPEDEDDEP